MVRAEPKFIYLGFVVLIALLGLADAIPVSRGKILIEERNKVVKNNEKTQEKINEGQHKKTMKEEVERQKGGEQENYQKETQEKEKNENYEKEKYQKEKGVEYLKEMVEKEKNEKYPKENSEKVKNENNEKENKGKREYEKYENENEDKENYDNAVMERMQYEKEKEEQNKGEDHSNDDSNHSPSTPTPYSPTSGRKRVRCRNTRYPQCYDQVHFCPSTCALTCEVDCVTCKPVCTCDYPGAICQDPRFIGGDGITFYFHGKKNKNFCIVTDTNLHINAHFIGKRNPNMRRDFTWVQSLGILFDNHKLFIGAYKTVTWNDSIDRLALVLDGEPIFLDEIEGFTWHSISTPTISITRISNTNSVVLDIQGILKINAKVVPISEEESRVHHYDITKDDCFAHLDLAFKFYTLGRKVGGVLGRTYKVDYVSKVKMGIIMPIVGREAEYETSSLFEPDCSVTRFQLNQIIKEDSTIKNLSSLSCVSENGINGVVCKK